MHIIICPKYLLNLGQKRDMKKVMKAKVSSVAKPNVKKTKVEIPYPKAKFTMTGKIRRAQNK